MGKDIRVILIKLADMLANITDHPTEAQEVRMLHNISALIAERKDLTEKNNLNNVLIVVVRYFGGIKLGAGGLFRAYSNSASEIIKKLDN